VLRIALVASRGPRWRGWLKALQTFDGGLDIMRPASWSVIPAWADRLPDAVRRRPWLHLWPHLWRLWRQGVLR
ncbi:MAG: hypothetical protein U5R48_08600, partial [Gammaproteobacteria bacterium]|nr:hypothetical protein [Gammaproteobacteria bacterium]